MKKFLGISGAVILIILVRLLVKDYFIKEMKKDNANFAEYNKSIKTAKNRKDSISIALKYGIIKAEQFVDSSYKNNPQFNNTLIHLFEIGVKRSEIDSFMRENYPYPIYNLYLNKIVAEVLKRNQNFKFVNNDKKNNKDFEFSTCVKNVLGSLAEYTLVFNEDKNLIIYKDVSRFKNAEYIFARNGEFCFQDENGQRDYGSWKCLNDNNFECYINKKGITDTLYFDSEHNIINSRHFARIKFK
jgi:hypothetical protein